MKEMELELMDMKIAPTLTAKDLKFSNVFASNLAIEKLTEAAMVNGDFEESEKEFIQYIKGLVH